MRKWVMMTALALLGCGGTGEVPIEDNAAHDATAVAPDSRSTGQEAEPANTGAPDEANEQNVSACLIQDGERIAENALHGIGTEPFWAVDVKGRCVTYSTPENQAGTRVWTQFSGTAENGTWTGALDNQRFVMRTEPQPGCSDGMSDKRYPIAVTLAVRGEQRRGCAEPR